MLEEAFGTIGAWKGSGKWGGEGHSLGNREGWWKKGTREQEEEGGIMERKGLGGETTRRRMLEGGNAEGKL